MPTPGAAGAVLIPAMIMLSKDVAWKPGPWLSITLALVIGLLMVSRVPTFAFKKLSINRRLVAPMLILVGLAVVSLATHFWLTLAGISAFNLLLTPFAWLLGRKARVAELNQTTTTLPAIDHNGPLT
jgi:CDP-diacylglycerol--serine O-phosphatidyltransferase